jgi:hypothetical protein
MQANFGDLLLWSFLLATGHGAGLMLLPVLLHTSGHSAHAGIDGVTATIVHSAATLVTTGVIAVLVYDWVGLAFLRRGWINMDWIWAAALIAAGLLIIVVRVI